MWPGGRTRLSRPGVGSLADARLDLGRVAKTHLVELYADDGGTGDEAVGALPEVPLHKERVTLTRLDTRFATLVVVLHCQARTE
jgi:hypothetical protein